MRIRYQNLKGKEVLADKEGRLLGTVRRIQIDSKKKSVLGIVFKGKVMSGEHWCRVNGVTRVGEDVVYLSSMKVVKDDEPPGRDVKDLIDLPINCMDGKRLGAVEDVIVETEGWKLAGVVIDRVGSVDVGPDAVFGADTVLLREGAADEIVAEPEASGFLARVFQSEEPQKPKPGARGKSRKK
ncbi:MAG: PRC-barrel domain-containing protein [Deltaproteobacteria bacterium]|nr:PRC-barrel domain-containing protein [Deltaproteobacteria bacterium]